MFSTKTLEGTEPEGRKHERPSRSSDNRDIRTDRRETPPTSKPPEKKKKSMVLDCGRPVNSTQFDHLTGIINRHRHPHVPEPEVAMIFRTKGGGADVDLSAVQAQLRKAKKEKPKSSQVYNQIGNYWRIKGDTQRSIECFRRALALAPNNSDAMLNLARVLFNLRLLDDAYELTRASLAALRGSSVGGQTTGVEQGGGGNAWLQQFTLGEILKARGRHEEAADHFRHTLDLHPGFHPAQAHLLELELAAPGGGGPGGEGAGGGGMTYYTLSIITLLVMAVLYGIVCSADPGGFDDMGGEGGAGCRTQRHFNRAMAMRSIKLGINPKLMRMRRQCAG